MDHTTALLLIDIQKGLDEWGFYGGNRNNPEAEDHAAKLLKKFRQEHLPIFHVRHSSQNPKSPLHASKPGFGIKDEVAPLDSEPLITKNVNSAFIGTDLKERLTALHVSNLVVVGLTTDHCISTTVRMAGNMRFKVYLASDATATFDRIAPNGDLFPAEVMHQTALASLHGEFATVVTTAKILAKF